MEIAQPFPITKSREKMLRKSILLTVVPALLLVAEVRGGVIYNAVADFSATENTSTSTWSYRATNDLSRDGSYELIAGPSSTFFSQPSWTAGAFKLIAANRSGGSVTVNTLFPFSWPNNTILMHPGGTENSSLGLVVVSWLAPSDGSADLAFEFTDLDTAGGDGVEWAVDLGDSSGNLASGTLFSTTTGLLTINDVQVKAGDRINFVVSPGDLGRHEFDSTGFTATVEHTPVPEPASWLLLTIALPLLVLFRRRRSFLQLSHQSV